VSERVLIVEDEPAIARSIAQFLGRHGFAVETAPDGEAALECLERQSFDCIATDIRMPRCDGVELLSRLRNAGCTEPVVVMSAHGSFELAVDVMKLGVQDFLRKPVDLAELEAALRRAISVSRMQRELTYLRDRHAGTEQFPEPVAEAAATRAICAELRRLALVARELEPGEAPPLLITGETGTGKSLLARHFHRLVAADGDAPFIEVNCTNLPAGLVDSELFGHEKGAFTDARTSRKGLMEAAEGGTLYLDEIGNLDLGIQGNLLSAIEEKTVRRVGGTAVRRVSLRFVASTNADLERCIAAGRFRADLFFRLATFRVHVPPLRERREDIDGLVQHFLERLSLKYGGPRRALDDDSRRILRAYDWPGNIREMRNLLERAVVLAPEGTITPAHLAGIARAHDAGGAAGPPRAAAPFVLPEDGIDWERMEADLLDQALRRAGGNLAAAARLLGMSRSRLRYRLERGRR
jgi:DNA-binding NtrC family response regulator